MHWMKKSVAVLTFGVVSVVAFAPNAEASKTRTFGIWGCLLPLGQATGLEQWVDYGQLQNTDSSGPLQAWCPLVNENTLDPADATAVVVRGWANGATGVSASACLTYSGGYGGTCGSSSTSSVGPSVFALTIASISAWTSAGVNDGYFVNVSIPATYAGSDSGIWSIDLTQ